MSVKNAEICAKLRESAEIIHKGLNLQKGECIAMTILPSSLWIDVMIAGGKSDRYYRILDVPDNEWKNVEEETK